MKKYFALFLSLLMLVSLLPGCGETSKEFDEEKIVFQFAAVSDLQHGIRWVPVDTYGRGVYAFKQLQDLALQYTDHGLDAVFFSGDLVNDCLTEQVEGFAQIYEEVFDPTEVPLIFSRGNHDVKHNPNSNREDLQLEDFYTILGDEYRSYDEKTSRIDIGCVHQIVGKYHFIAVTPLNSGWENNADGSAKYAEEVIEWLDETLATVTKKNPGQYVFVSTHPLIYDTTYGSNLIVNNMSWFTKELTPVLEKYPQVVTFGGHLHFSINDERSIMQTTFTSLNCGSMAYMATEPGNYRHMMNLTVMEDCTKVSNGYLVQIDKYNNVRFLRINFYLEELIKEPWVLMAPQEDGSHLLSYTKDRGSAENNPAPVLAADAITVTDDRDTVPETTPIRPRIKFQSATDDDQIHNYRLVVTDEAGQVVEEVNLLADSYLHTDPTDMRDEWSLYMERGPYERGRTYTISLTAWDDWGAATETVTCAYTT